MCDCRSDIIDGYLVVWRGLSTCRLVAFVKHFRHREMVESKQVRGMMARRDADRRGETRGNVARPTRVLRAPFKSGTAARTFPMTWISRLLNLTLAVYRVFSTEAVA